MKKFSFFLNCAASALFVIALTACSDVKDNPSGDDNPAKQTVVINDGDVLADVVNQMAATAGDEIIVEIPAGISVTTGEIKVPTGKKLTIAGNSKNPATITVTKSIVASNNIVVKDVVLDGQKTTDPIFKLDGVPEKFVIENISFTNVIAQNLKSQLIYGNKQYCLIEKLAVDNCIISQKGASKKTFFDFNSSGNVIDFSITNSTLWADKSTAWQNGGFFSTQSAKKLGDYFGIDTSADGFKQKVTIENCTFYNVAYGKTTSTPVQNSQTWMLYTVKNSIIADCGKSKQFLKGLNNGQTGKDVNWDVDGNVFMFDGAIIDEQTVGSKAENIKNSVKIDPGFSMVNYGYFHPTNKSFPTTVGDLRWFEDAAKWQ